MTLDNMAGITKGSYTGGDVSTKQKVTAWMPLPEPYGGGDDNDE